MSYTNILYYTKTLKNDFSCRVVNICRQWKFIVKMNVCVINDPLKTYYRFIIYCSISFYHLKCLFHSKDNLNKNTRTRKNSAILNQQIYQWTVDTEKRVLHYIIKITLDKVHFLDICTLQNLTNDKYRNNKLPLNIFNNFKVLSILSI